MNCLPSNKTVVLKLDTVDSTEHLERFLDKRQEFKAWSESLEVFFLKLPVLAISDWNSQW
jgi:hypothetical protein